MEIKLCARTELDLAGNRRTVELHANREHPLLYFVEYRPKTFSEGTTTWRSYLHAWKLIAYDRVLTYYCLPEPLVRKFLPPGEPIAKLFTPEKLKTFRNFFLQDRALDAWTENPDQAAQLKNYYQEYYQRDLEKTGGTQTLMDKMMTNGLYLPTRVSVEALIDHSINSSPESYHPSQDSQVVREAVSLDEKRIA